MSNESTGSPRQFRDGSAYSSLRDELNIGNNKSHLDYLERLIISPRLRDDHPVSVPEAHLLQKYSTDQKMKLQNAPKFNTAQKQSNHMSHLTEYELNRRFGTMAREKPSNNNAHMQVYQANLNNYKNVMRIDENYKVS